MKLVIVTSCTGKKRVNHRDPLRRADFENGAEHLVERKEALRTFGCPARDMYAGQQHVRLMRGVERFKEAVGNRAEVEVWVLSAGFGFMSEGDHVVPYDISFANMSAKEAAAWAEARNIPGDFQTIVSQAAERVYVALGKKYLRACALDQAFMFPNRTTFVGTKTKTLSKIVNAQSLVDVVELAHADATRYRCGLVGLKGEYMAVELDRVARRIIKEAAE